MTEFTPQKKEKFIQKLRAWPNVARAARLAGVSRQTVYNHRETDEEFADLWDEALAEGVEKLAEEAERRAFQGVLEPVYYQGEVVGKVRKFSDTLAIFLLKAHDPKKYAERMDVTSGGEPLQAPQIFLPAVADEDEAADG